MGRIESFIICEFHDISHGDQNSRAWQNRERLLDSKVVVSTFWGKAVE